MAIRPDDLLEAFQESEGFPFGSRTIDFYENLGYQKKDILELFANGIVEAQDEVAIIM